MPADAGIDRDVIDRNADARAAGEALAAFYRAAEPAMRDLPIYNAALKVAAIGFRALDDCAFGVVVTPWFMNLVRLPLDPRATALSQGDAVARSLPAGTLEFTVGRLDGFGAIESCSLFSPMFGFADQPAAETAAAAALEAVLDPQFDAAAATAEPRAPEPAPQPPAPLDRRRFLRGELTERRP
jgi:[NiFe] hydrogenase assembly HybE family chaperone